MPRTPSTNNQGEITNAVTLPVRLVQIEFGTVLRLSSRQDITYDGDAFTGEAMDVAIAWPNASIRLYDHEIGYASDFLSEGPGAVVKIWEVYGAGNSFAAADADLVYEGQLGSAEVAEWIEIECRPHKTSFCPKYIISDDIFSHLPPDGTRIEARGGTYVLTRNDP